MQPGRYRTQPITLGSLAGLNEAQIAPAVGQLLSRHPSWCAAGMTAEQEAHHTLDVQGSVVFAALGLLVALLVQWPQGWHERTISSRK